MSNKRNSVFSAVVPVLGASQTTTPIPLGTHVITHHQNAPDSDPTVRYSTGSTLLDSFVHDAEYDAFSLQTELTSLSLELKRIANPRMRTRARPSTSRKVPVASPDSTTPDAAVQAKRAAIAKARQQAQQQAMKAIAQAKRLSQQADEHKANGSSISNRAEAQSALPKGQPLNRTAGGTEARLANSGQPPAPAPNAAVKVYGGADYKAMQARAQAGGLVNLEDDLLFGGAEKSAAGKKRRAVSAAKSESDFLIWLAQPLEDFTCSPVPGGWHPTAHLDEASQESECQTVLGTDSFELSDLELSDPHSESDVAVDSAPEAGHKLEVSSEQDEALPSQLSTKIPEDGNEPADSELADLDTLGKQVTHLNRRIEFLSKKLAVMAQAESAQVNRSKAEHGDSVAYSAVVLGPDAFNLSNDTLTSSNGASEERLATLGPLVSAL